MSERLNWAKLKGLFRRGIVDRVDSAKKCQLISAELLKDDLQNEIEHAQPYGFSSKPLTGSEIYVANIGADGAHPIALCVADRRHRPTDQDDGEVALHNHTGSRIDVKADGSIVVSGSGGATVTLLADGTVEVDASEIRLGAGATESALLGDLFQTYFNTHTHSTGVGPSGPPLSPSIPAHLASITKVK